MKRPLNLPLATALALFFAATSYGRITDVTFNHNAGDGLNCDAVWTYAPLDDATVNINLSGTQVGSLGCLGATLLSDTVADPAAVMYAIVQNNTAAAWNGYTATVTMNVPFSIVLPSVVPADWSINITPVVPSGPLYTAQVIYTAGTLVPIGGDFEFGYRVNFDGAIQYQLDQDFAPQLVPEPTTLGVFGLGTLLLVLRNRRLQ